MEEKIMPDHFTDEWLANTLIAVINKMRELGPKNQYDALISYLRLEYGLYINTTDQVGVSCSFVVFDKENHSLEKGHPPKSRGSFLKNSEGEIIGLKVGEWGARVE